MLNEWKYKVQVSRCDPRYAGCQTLPELDRGYDDLSAARMFARKASDGFHASVNAKDGECLFEFIDGEPYAPAPY